MPGPAALDCCSSKLLIEAAREELRQGRPARACARIGHLIRADPGNADALHLKGLIEAHRGMWSASVACFRQALEHSPANNRWLRDLAAALAAEGEWSAAASTFFQVIEHSPKDYVAIAGYGRALLELDRAGQAIPYLLEAVRLRGSANTLLSLGRALAAQRRWARAVEVLQRASALEPTCVEVQRALAIVSFNSGKFETSRRSWESALRLVPGDPEAETEFLRVSWMLGDLRCTLGAIQKNISSGVASEQLHSFGLYLQMYDKQSRAARRRGCEEFGRRIVPSRIRRFSARGPFHSTAKMRIGYLSGEFIGGPPFYFLAPLIGNHDRQNFEIFLYHTRDKYDAATAWYRRRGHWRDCRDLDDTSIREWIDRDGIQILVDLSGFFPQNRLRIFAGRAAPVQATYPNCPTTTGVAEIDYIFTDRWTCGPGHESQYTERPIFLPSGYLAYSPPADSPSVTRLPATRNGYVTFGVFQRPAKMHADFFDAVAEILHRCDRSHLLVQNHDPGLDDPDASNHQQLIAEFAARGISENRISLCGARPHRKTLEVMAEADIALDTFPYQGQTTTCECLWQGVPVVALSGATHVSRVGSSILRRTDLHQFVARTQPGYVRKAVSLAAAPAALARLRTGMRDQLLRSNLLDGPLLARNVERMYWLMWKAWIRGKT
jgi:protein O-GlcNAc transferase